MSAIRDPIFACLLSQGRLDANGYAYHGHTRSHIVAWCAVNGPVPKDHVLDHLCRRRACREPSHLEPVTAAENQLRRSFRYLQRRKLCPKGHDLSLHRVVTPERGIVCRRCNQLALGEP
jgi:hypothetical protein